MGRTTCRRSCSAGVGIRHSSKMEFTSFSSVERRVLGGTSPRRWDLASFRKFSAESFHACFVAFVASLVFLVDIDDRKRLDAGGVVSLGVREGASRPPRPQCIRCAALEIEVSAFAGGGPHRIVLRWQSRGSTLQRMALPLPPTTH